MTDNTYDGIQDSLAGIKSHLEYVRGHLVRLRMTRDEKEIGIVEEVDAALDDLDRNEIARLFEIFDK